MHSRAAGSPFGVPVIANRIRLAAGHLSPIENRQRRALGASEQLIRARRTVDDERGGRAGNKANRIAGDGRPGKVCHCGNRRSEQVRGGEAARDRRHPRILDGAARAERVEHVVKVVRDDDNFDAALDEPPDWTHRNPEGKNTRGDTDADPALGEPADPTLLLGDRQGAERKAVHECGGHVAGIFEGVEHQWEKEAVGPSAFVGVYFDWQSRRRRDTKRGSDVVARVVVDVGVRANGIGALLRRGPYERLDVGGQAVLGKGNDTDSAPVGERGAHHQCGVEGRQSPCLVDVDDGSDCMRSARHNARERGAHARGNAGDVAALGGLEGPHGVNGLDQRVRLTAVACRRAGLVEVKVRVGKGAGGERAVAVDLRRADRLAHSPDLSQDTGRDREVDGAMLVQEADVAHHKVRCRRTSHDTAISRPAGLPVKASDATTTKSRTGSAAQRVLDVIAPTQEDESSQPPTASPITCLAMNGRALEQLAEKGFDAVRGTELTDLASWCDDWCVQTGDARFCIVGDTLSTFSDWWDEHSEAGGVPASLLHAASACVRTELPGIITDPEPASASIAAARMRSEFFGLMAHPSEWRTLDAR